MSNLTEKVLLVFIDYQDLKLSYAHCDTDSDWVYACVYYYAMLPSVKDDAAFLSRKP